MDAKSALGGAIWTIFAIKNDKCYAAGSMRRSSIWFLIAFLWLIDTVLTVIRHGARQAVLAALVTVAFLLVGVFMRVRENRTRPNYRFKPTK